MEHFVRRKYIASRHGLAVAELLVDGREVRTGRIEQLREVLDDEVRLLEGVDPVTGVHHALKVEPDAVRRRRVDRIDGFALGTDDAGTVDSQALLRPDQAELHRVPIEAGQGHEGLRTDGGSLPTPP